MENGKQFVGSLEDAVAEEDKRLVFMMVVVRVIGGEVKARWPLDPWQYFKARLSGAAKTYTCPDSQCI
jgi:hypothetical protein